MPAFSVFASRVSVSQVSWILASVLGLALIWMPVKAQAAEPRRIGDWLLVCNESGAEPVCEGVQSIRQRLTGSDGMEQVREVLRLTLKKTGEGEFVLHVRAPLGIRLSNGLVIGWGEGEGEFAQVGFATCTAQGCHAFWRIDEAIIDALKASERLSLTFGSMSSTDRATVRSSLVGFDDLLETGSFK